MRSEFLRPVSGITLLRDVITLIYIESEFSYVSEDACRGFGPVRRFRFG